MKRVLNLILAVAATMTLTSCNCSNESKFNAKDYAERKTEKLDKIVDLTDAQEKEVYAVYLEQGKTIKKNMKAAQKECKKADCQKADCKKAECTKGECKKADCKKAECTKADCQKADCKKGECTKGECQKADCQKAECTKGECPKVDCKKGECTKCECKKADCKKADCKKAECTKCEAKCEKHCRPHRPHLISPDHKRASFEKIRNILTEQQRSLLKEHFAKRRECAPHAKCEPTPAEK